MTVALGIQYLFWYLISMPVALFVRVRRERVIIGSNRGDGLSGNGRYLFERWGKEGIFEVWAVLSNKEIYQQLSIQYDHVLFAFSWKAVKVIAQARFFIMTHGRLDIPFSGFKKIIIQTWHGIPFKAIGFYRNKNIKDKIRNILYKWLDYDSIDYFLSSSAYVTRLYTGVFRQESGKFLEIGFPRNDIFFDREKSGFSIGLFLKERELIFKKVILYVPTFRTYASMYFPFEDRAEKFQHLIELLKRTDSVCLVKSHVNQQYKLDAPLEKSGRIIDISNDGRIPDVQKILPETDVLITDYSSVSIDGLLLDLPCIFITSDIEDYVKATGEFCCDYNSMAAGAHVQTMSEMIYELNELLVGNDSFREERSSARKLFFRPPSSNSTERLSSFMRQII